MIITVLLHRCFDVTLLLYVIVTKSQQNIFPYSMGVYQKDSPGAGMSPVRVSQISVMEMKRGIISLPCY